MELKLNIYDGKRVIKTYTAETIDFSFGVVEDILDALDFEHVSGNADIAKMIIKCSKQLKPFLMDIFEGVTADEIRNTRIQNLIDIFKGLYQYATGELGAAAGSAKNQTTGKRQTKHCIRSYLI